MNNRKRTTQELTLTALLTALAIVIPLYMPVKAPPFGPFTATLASHTPTIIAMFISPMSAIVTSLGSAFGFLFAYNPVVSARAAMHVVFALTGALMIRKRMNFFLTVAVTLVLHTLSDMGIVWLIAAPLGMGEILKGEGMAIAQAVIGVGTSLHHIVDYAIAMAIIAPLSKAFKNLFPHTFRKKGANYSKKKGANL
ncbi:MAG: ECF transporter S component [Clostridia bacterium]|nr:ECF transporter S component [Clostridia bacterium]